MSINTPRITATTLSPELTATPSSAVRKITATTPSIMKWPASILANSLTIKLKGLVNIPIISIRGISGRGTLSQVGTSGQKMSFQ